MTGDLPEGRYGAGCGTVDDTMWVVGGWNGRQSWKEVHSLDLLERSWKSHTVKGKWPDSRTGGCWVQKGTQLFMIGGWNGKNLAEVHNDVWRFDTTQLKWTKLRGKGKRPSALGRHACASVEKGILVIGGTDSGDKHQSDTYLLLLEGSRNVTWTKLELKGLTPYPRAHSHLVNLAGDGGDPDSEILLFGGDNHDSLFDDIFKLNLDKKLWKKMKGPAPKRTQGAVSVIGSQIVLFGGSNDTGHCNRLSVWDGSSWTSPEIEGKPPADRSNSCLSYHHDHYVLFAGNSKGGTMHGDTFTLHPPSIDTEAKEEL